MAGTSTIIPTKPYTTDGMPASSSTAPRMTLATLGGATLERNSAVNSPTGTPIRMAPAVPYTEVRMKGRIPNDGSRVVVAGSQTCPVRKSQRPICRMAGTPETIR